MTLRTELLHDTPLDTLRGAAPKGLLRDLNFERFLYKLGRPVIDGGARMLFQMDIAKHVPLPPGPKIFTANHPSTTDPFLLTLAASEPLSILITEGVFKIPVLGSLIKAAGQIPVVKDNGRMAFEEAQRRLALGGSIGIFAEGAISPRDGGFNRPRTGAARLALSSGVPVIPVGIHLLRERLHFIDAEIDGKDEVVTWYFSGPYAMTVGQPLYFSGDVEDRPYVRQASAQIMSSIIGLAYESKRRISTAALPAPLITRDAQIA